MSSRRFKTVILVMLLAANLCLLAALAPLYWQKAHQPDELEGALLRLMEQQQIRFEPAALPAEQTLYSLELTYSAEAEFDAVNRLLPEARADVSSPYQTHWTARNGTCTAAISGAFTAQLTRPLAEEPTALLEQMGFESAAVRQDDGRLTVWQKVFGVQVLSPLVLTLEDGGVTALEGCFLFYTGMPTRVSEEAACSAADALVAFLAEKDSLGWVGETIHSLEQGYLPAESAAVLRLHPVWRIRTDTAVYEVDGLTRSVYLVE